MFGKKTQPPIGTLIGEGTVIRGELRFTDGLRIDGEIIGDVRYEVLEMHQGATIDGELKPLKSEDRPALKLATPSHG